ncbi:MAG: hypothetical protein LIO65_03735 [Odoribacter sp.]|nr:hypothetical protein [Odoribacter sp.]
MSGFELKKATYYYYGLLNENEKSLYRNIMSAMLQHIEAINLNGSFSKIQIGKVISFIDKDRPDIFWVDSGYTMTIKNGVIIKVTLKYTFSPSEKNNMIRNIENSKFYREINSVLSKKKSSFEKALAAYEYIITHTEYEERALRDNSTYYSYAYCLYGAILKSRAVCSGYSKTFQYFMSKHNVICTLVTGNTKRGRHAWNLINLYGSYYYIDTTWGDPIFSGNSIKQSDYVSYDYFCITTEDLRKSHNPILDEKMPLCTDTKYNYYRFFLA